MLNPKLFSILLTTVLPIAVISADEIPGPIAENGELLFSDDFHRSSTSGSNLGDWKVIIPGFQVTDGILIASQDRADHGSVGRVYVPMRDVVMSFRFKLAGSPMFNVVFDDKDHKGSHAGHICRVAVAKKQIRLGDDKEGIMRNDIFEIRRDPKQKEAADKLIQDRGSSTRVDLQSGQWHSMKIEILDDQMRVSLDGEAIGYLKSPGIAHPTKRSVHFTVNGKETHFDNVEIYTARPIK